MLGVFFTDYLGDLTCTSLTTASFSCPKMGIAAMSMSDGEGDGKLTSCRRTQAQQQQQQQQQQQRNNRRKRQRNAFFSWLSLDSHNHAYTCIRRTVSSRITEKVACWVPTGRRTHLSTDGYTPPCIQQLVRTMRQNLRTKFIGDGANPFPGGRSQPRLGGPAISKPVQEVCM